MFENLNTKKIGIIVVVLLVLATLFTAINVIDQGNIGLVVDRAGGAKGTAKVQEKNGVVFVVPFMQRLFEYPGFQQHKEYPALQVLAAGGLPFTVTPKFNYEINRSQAVNMFQRFRKPITAIEDEFIKTAVMQVFNDVTNAYDPDRLINQRTQYEADLTTALRKQLEPYFKVSRVTSGLTPPDELTTAIKNKATAVQQAQTAENQKRVIIAEGEKQIAQARADSASRVIRAQATAKENQLLQQSLTPLLVQKQWIEAWQKGGSQVPTYMAGNGGQFLMQMPVGKN